MIKKERNERIRKEYASGKTLAQVAKMNKISLQRVHRIVKETTKLCKKHSVYYYSRCAMCTKNSSLDIFQKNSKIASLKKEIGLCSSKKKDEALSFRRKKLIKKLKDVHGLSLSSIAKLLKRTHSSISYNYND